ncbi:hypothetical protein HGA34_02420 [Candidatus Falkowbacteria bacterium]|nr:hypothetical protein [Candidatus Falkowbacteria bacterium]
MEYRLPLKTAEVIVAMGPESDGNFSVCTNGKIYHSESFGDLLEEKNFRSFKSALQKYLKREGLVPTVVLTDLHPDFLTTIYGRELAKKNKARLATVQHHLAHVFSAVGDRLIDGQTHPDSFVGIAADGTGLGDDGLIWGGEIFKINISKKQASITRIGHLENQTLIGGDLAIREPARVLVSVLGKFLGPAEVFSLIKQYYPKKTFDLLVAQASQRFNCYETSSTGRILDAAAVLLGFSPNERKRKHGPIACLEENSSTPYLLKPAVTEDDGMLILKTTELFAYLAARLDGDKRRLAATAQKYIADGLGEIAKTGQAPIYFAGGMANNKIISSVLADQGAYLSTKIPRGDAGISFGQVIYFLLADSRD